jgi:hypothetical protein
MEDNRNSIGQYLIFIFKSFIVIGACTGAILIITEYQLITSFVFKTIIVDARNYTKPIAK